MNSNIKNKDYLADFGKLPPQAIDLEIAVLGALLLDPSCIGEFYSIFNPEIFYKSANQMICKAMRDLHDSKAPIDILTVIEQLRKNNDLELVGGNYYVASLTNHVSSNLNANYHIRIIYQKWIQREIIRISSKHINEAYQDNTDVFDSLNKAIEAFEGLNVKKKETIVKKMSSQTSSVITNLTTTNDKVKKTYYKIGHPELDRLMPLSTNNILLIGGKSGVGKTKFVVELMDSLLVSFYKEVSIFWACMEDPIDKMLRCFISRRILLTDDQLLQKNYVLNTEEKEFINNCKEEFDNFDVEFVDYTSYVKDLGTNFKYFCQARPDKFNVLIIDNLMLLKDNTNNKNQTEIDDHIARSIKTISEETKGLIIMLHHFTDEQLAKMYQKDAYRPRESHLKGSTRYRDISTQIMLLNKPDNYGDLMLNYKHIKDIMSYLFISEIVKNRNGDKGILRWYATLGYNIFKNITS